MLPRPRPAALARLSAEQADWPALAVLLAGLLAESRAQQAADAERHAADRAGERAEHRRSLVQDREDFLDVVAHELKTPVAVIKAYAEVLQEQLDDQPVAPEVRQVVATILEQVDLMTGLIEGVLDVQRLRLGKLPLEIGRVDLAALARAVAEEIQHTTCRHAIRVRADGRLPPLAGDRHRLRQVLMNLVANAVKFSRGGEIEVRVGRGPWAERDCARVSIRDQGVGVAPADLNRIFEQFEQVTAEPVQGHVGLGLGLYIARQTARAHGGDVWAESAGLGLGSTFHLALPIEADELPE